MCIGGRTPAPPPVLPEAPQVPEQAEARTTGADRKRRAAATGGGASGTILTGSRGVGRAGTTTNKTLLGE